MKADELDALVAFFEHLRPESLAEFGRYYAGDAYFKDPFNEVQGLPAIRRIFTHLFAQLVEPRFVVHERVTDEGGAVLLWTMFYRTRPGGQKAGAEQSIRGVSHLRFDAGGKVVWHRDYWDAAEELYAKLPLLGWLMRWLQKKLAS